MNLPPWFVAAMAECETLSLDVRSDRERLWSVLSKHLPVRALESALQSSLSAWLVRDGGLTRGEVNVVIEHLTHTAATAALEAIRG